jgi:hypothetical protein
MKQTCLLIAALLLAAIPSYATNTVEVEWSYNNGSLSILGNTGSPLAGNPTVNSGTGYVLQLGYYTTANSSNPFSGTWVPVFGPGTSNSLFSTAGMGTYFFDGSGGTLGSTGTDDSFSFDADVTSATPSTETGIPSAGQIMSIRYYNATTLGAATFFGAASDPSWQWISPGSPAAGGNAFDIYGDSNIMYQGGASVPETNISLAVPEPTPLSLVCGAVALGAVVLRRRR